MMCSRLLWEDLAKSTPSREQSVQRSWGGSEGLRSWSTPNNLRLCGGQSERKSGARPWQSQDWFLHAVGRHAQPMQVPVQSRAFPLHTLTGWLLGGSLQHLLAEIETGGWVVEVTCCQRKQGQTLLQTPCTALLWPQAAHSAGLRFLPGAVCPSALPGSLWYPLHSFTLPGFWA